MGNHATCLSSDAANDMVENDEDASSISCGICVHQYSFPMYVVKVSDFLQMQGPPEPHHVLKERGLLHEWQPGMFAIFISHQWLGKRAPDPSGKQLAVLRKVLGRLIDKSLKVEADMTKMLDMPAPTSYEQIEHGYLFLDWFAIPQITARTDGINEDATKSDAALAVQSIPAYVEACDLFFALVPELLHVDTGLDCNYISWLSRGWCRAELWCRLLSNRKDTSVIVIHSGQEALYIYPLDWQRNLISDGLFTVESDRAEVAKLGEMALSSKIQHLRQWGPLVRYRFYLACRPRMLSQPKLNCDLESFLLHFDFPNIKAAVQHESGMTGMLCAVLNGDSTMLHSLVEHRADANARVFGLADLGYYDTQSLLMVAVKSCQDAGVLSSLLSLRADPNLRSRAGITAVWLAQEAFHVSMLLEHRADLFTADAIPPLIGAVGRASSETVRVLLESRSDPNYSGVLQAVPMFGRANANAAESIRLLLEFRADVNGRNDFKGSMYWECMRASVYTAIWGYGSSVYQRNMANMPGATALGVAAMMGHKGVVEVLLECEADPEIPNQQGQKPLDVALLAGQCHLLPILCTFAT